MKITKPFCIDDDLINQLAKTNASELVNRLLHEHFDGVNNKNLGVLKQKLSKNVAEKRKIGKEIKEIRLNISEIERKERIALNLAKKIPSNLFKAMNDYSDFFKYWVAFREELRKLTLSRDEIKNIFYELKGGINKQ